MVTAPGGGAPGGSVPSLALHHGIRCVPEPGMTVKYVLVGVGELICYDGKLCSVSWMNKAVVVLVMEETLVE